MKTLGRPETFSKNIFKNFFKQLFKKKKMQSFWWLVLQHSRIAHHCQISCCIKKFCYSWV